MPWASNPSLMSTPTEATTASQPAVSDPEASLPQSATSSQSLLEGFRPPSNHFTLYQIFYIVVVGGLGSAAISGIINFAIAYGMYATADTSKWPIRLWQFPYTLAGDGGLSIPIQCTITWWLEVWLVNRHLRRGRVQAIGFMPEPKTRFFRWFMFLDRQQREQDHKLEASMIHWMLFAGSHFARALIVSAVAFTVMWAPSVAVLMFVSLSGDEKKFTPGCEHDWCYKKKWAPQIFKSVKGSVLGILTTPLFVMFWLVRCGWALKNNEAHYGER
ncbi:hypothetical protein DL765_008575 [Monosporascus sp. GIB2]|nr:hypothetical protein DL765_008575 [Monosporascus sp. GIB2]